MVAIKRMSTSTQCRVGLHIGLSAISYAKVSRSGDKWKLVSCGEIGWENVISNPAAMRVELQSLLQQLVKQESLNRELVHVSLHNRMCVTRVVTGDRHEVAEQLEEISDNSQHYLQLGLGEQMIGHITVPIDDSRQHGQVSIIKRGLIEGVESAAIHAGLEVLWIDGALTSVCRLVGLAGLDRTPLLMVWIGSSGAEIAISYKGRLQLNYHAGECCTPEQAANTIGKHLKRLRRFCDRYRQVEGKSDLRRVLVLTKPGGDAEIRERLEQFDFEKVHVLRDLYGTELADRLGGQSLCSAGVASALGGLLVHLEPNVIPTTDVFSKYLLTKPRSLRNVVFKDGWHVLVAAALLVGMLCTDWALRAWVDANERASTSLVSNFDLERQQLLELDRQRKILAEFKRLQTKITSATVRDVITRVATCLPEDCRLDWCGIDAQGQLVLKGTMLQGDQTYEVLKALRDLPEISEVALESVGSASNYGKTATLFEIHCEISSQPSKSNSRRIADHGTNYPELLFGNVH